MNRSAAVLVLFEKHEFDTLFLLHDGMPSDGDLVSPEGIVCQVQARVPHR